MPWHQSPCCVLRLSSQSSPSLMAFIKQGLRLPLFWVSPPVSLSCTSSTPASDWWIIFSCFLGIWKQAWKNSFCKVSSLRDSLVQTGIGRTFCRGKNWAGTSGQDILIYSPRPFLRTDTQTCTENLGWGSLCILSWSHTSYHTQLRTSTLSYAG